MNKLIVISGCSGGGKSTLLEELAQQGFTTIPEAGREVYRQYAESAKDPNFMAEKIIEKAVADYHRATTIKSPKDNVIFFDRSFLECASYFKNLKNDKYDAIVKNLRYAPIILMAPPWPGIYRHDAERQHAFEDGVKEYELLKEYYPRFGYEILELPFTNVKERAKFVINLTHTLK